MGAGQADTGHTGDDVFDLGWEDRHTGDFEDAFNALFEMKITVIVHKTIVAGMDPVEAVGMDADRLGSGGLIMEVADHPGRSVDTKFTVLPVGDGGQSLGIDDFHQDIGQGQADCFGPGLELGIDSTNRDRLGQAIAFAQRAGSAAGLDERIEAILEISRQGITPTEDRFQAGQVGIFQVVVSEYPFIQGRDSCNKAGFFL